MILAGALAQHFAPSSVIAVTGLLGVVAAVSVSMLQRMLARPG
jgi:hypothetical protein